MSVPNFLRTLIVRTWLHDHAQSQPRGEPRCFVLENVRIGSSSAGCGLGRIMVSADECRAHTSSMQVAQHKDSTGVLDLLTLGSCSVRWGVAIRFFFRTARYIFWISNSLLIVASSQVVASILQLTSGTEYGPCHFRHRHRLQAVRFVKQVQSCRYQGFQPQSLCQRTTQL